METHGADTDQACGLEARSAELDLDEPEQPTCGYVGMRIYAYCYTY